MRLTVTVGFLLLGLLAGSYSPVTCEAQQAPPNTSDTKFVYADFERVENGKVVSNNGGLVQMFTAQETTPVKYRGAADGSPAPEIVRAKGDEKNHFASFDYTLLGPNQWANVTLEIQSRPYKDQKPGFDDLSGYKTMSLQLYATGADYIRIEFINYIKGTHAFDITTNTPETIAVIDKTIDFFKENFSHPVALPKEFVLTNKGG